MNYNSSITLVSQTLPAMSSNSKVEYHSGFSALLNQLKPTKYQNIYENFKSELRKDKTLFVIIGPTKSGKTTISSFLERYFPRIKTATTRPKRKDEDPDQYVWINDPKNGNETPEEYRQRISNTYDLVESNYFAGNVYGTPRESFSKAFKNNDVAIIVSENNGAKAFQKLFSHEYNVIVIFVLPDNLDIIKNRLGDRNNIEERLQIAQKEVKESFQVANYFVHNVDASLMNSSLENAIDTINRNVLSFLEDIRTNVNNSKLTNKV